MNVTPLDLRALQFEVEQFLYREAALLDARRYHEWLDLLDEHIHYWMPNRRTAAEATRTAEFAGPGEHAYFDDDRRLLEQRIKKLDTRKSWSEEPPSRTRHLITNVRITAHDRYPEIDVSSNFIVYRSRLSTDEDLWVGEREDVLVATPAGWVLRRRAIYLDQTVLRSKNLSTFL